MPDRQDELPLFSQTPRGPRPSSTLRAQTSLSATITAWGEELTRAGRSIHTVKAFTGDLRLLAHFAGAGQAVANLGTHDLKNFLEWMVSKRGVPCSPKTYSRRVTSLKAFFRWLVDQGVLASDPSEPLVQQTVLSPLPEVLTLGEIEAVLEAAQAFRSGPKPDARPYTLAALLLHTGIKKGECLALRLNHVDLSGPDGPTLFVRYGDVRKRYKERRLPLDRAWIQAYREYLAQYSPRDRLFPWSPRRLEYLLEDIGQAAGLKKHLSFDMCRWTCALNDYRAGMDRDGIRQKLGISRIQWREVGAKLDRLAAQQS
ncbi:MAG: tyrosine-type recombinase/integrase [Chloroflexota bacterium]